MIFWSVKKITLSGVSLEPGSAWGERFDISYLFSKKNHKSARKGSHLESKIKMAYRQPKRSRMTSWRLC